MDHSHFHTITNKLFKIDGNYKTFRWFYDFCKHAVPDNIKLCSTRNWWLKEQTLIKHSSEDQKDLQQTSLKCHQYYHSALHGANRNIQHQMKWVLLWSEDLQIPHSNCTFSRFELLYDTCHLHSWRLLWFAFNRLFQSPIWATHTLLKPFLNVTQMIIAASAQPCKASHFY